MKENRIRENKGHFIRQQVSFESYYKLEYNIKTIIKKERRIQHEEMGYGRILNP